MKDKNGKKCCNNCKYDDCCLYTKTQECGYRKYKLWQRNPDLWLDILPDKAGWYWWRYKEKNKSKVIFVKEGEKRLWVLDEIDHCWFELRKLNGQFQGPIEPKGDK